MNKKTQESAPESVQQTQEQHNTTDATTAQVKKKAGRPAKTKAAEITVSNEPVAIFGCPTTTVSWNQAALQYFVTW